MKKDEIILELKKISRELGKSPGRREIPSMLNRFCVNEFGSLNNAKIKARLSIAKRKCDPLPKSAYKLDKRLVRIVSYLTFDGHLYGTLKGFHFSSNHKKDLEILREDVRRKFGVDVFTINKGGMTGKCYRYWYFNTNISKLLHSLGTPCGDKMITKFDVPGWIKKDKELGLEYLRMAFLCEGTKYKVSKNTERIQINLNKSEEFLEDGLKFMDSLKVLLKKFGIKTTSVKILQGNINRKKDGRTTRLLRFRILAESTDTFIKQIGWLK